MAIILVTTEHKVIGYTENVEIVAKALRHSFGFEDNSHVLTAVAAHVWAEICGRGGDHKSWSSRHVQSALHSVNVRVAMLQAQLSRMDSA